MNSNTFIGIMREAVDLIKVKQNTRTGYGKALYRAEKFVGDDVKCAPAEKFSDAWDSMRNAAIEKLKTKDYATHDFQSLQALGEFARKYVASSQVRAARPEPPADASVAEILRLVRALAQQLGVS